MLVVGGLHERPVAVTLTVAPDDVSVAGVPQAETPRAAISAATAKTFDPFWSFLCIFVSPWVDRVAFIVGVELAIMMPRTLHRVF
jgi:hypothetical protein